MPQYSYKYPRPAVSVDCVAISPEGGQMQVLLIKRKNEPFKGHWAFPGGFMEIDEDAATAARRELLEETGYGNGEWSKLMTIAPNPSSMNNWTHCFLAVGVEKIANQSLDATEELTVHLMSEAEVKSLLENDQIYQALMVAPLYKYFHLKKG